MEGYAAKSAIDGRGIAADLAPAIDCARIAAAKATGYTFPGDSAVLGYGERSIMFFAPPGPCCAASLGAVLKVYSHRATKRRSRELAGLHVAGKLPSLRVPRVLGSSAAPGAQPWLSMTRLAGRPLDQFGSVLDQRFQAKVVARVAARLHCLPAADLAGLDPYALRLCEAPVPDPEVEALRTGLAAAYTPLNVVQAGRCVIGFVHGDLAAGNILLDELPAGNGDVPVAAIGLIDFERAGVGCVYEDLARMCAGAAYGQLGDLLVTTYTAERDALGTPLDLDADHLLWHLARHLRWVLQWSPEIDPGLTVGVSDLAVDTIERLVSASGGSRA